MRYLLLMPLLKMAFKNSNGLVTVIDFRMAFSGLKDDLKEVF